jgi:hypothetical protein
MAWTDEDTEWLEGLRYMKIDDLGFVSDMIHDDPDLPHLVAGFIRLAVPELEVMDDRELLRAYIEDEEDLQSLVHKDVFNRLKDLIPALLPYYQDTFNAESGDESSDSDSDGESSSSGSHDSRVLDEDIEVCIFMYVNEKLKKYGLFDMDVYTVYEDGMSLTDTAAREGSHDNIEFFKRYRAAKGSNLVVLM